MEIFDALLVFTLVMGISTIIIHMKLRVFGKPIKQEWKTIYAKTIPNHQSSVALIKNYLSKLKTKTE